MKFIKIILLILSIGLFVSCSINNPSKLRETQAFTQVYRVVGGDKVIVRAITNQASCPSIQWDNSPPSRLSTRVGAEDISIRINTDQVPSKFSVTTCEIEWPNGVSQANINGQTLKALKSNLQRIVIIGDTGCRLKASENAFQDCNSIEKWPFAQTIQSAFNTNPDLVVHVGDIHYRESPCPESREGCKNSPWGYGFDAWNADFFIPAKLLLDATPWVFVRGNHEACSRAGQGWHRFVDIRPWNEKLSCNDPKNDDFANYTEPYAVQIGKSSQIVVFDSANMPSKDIKPKDFSYQVYKNQIKKAEDLAKNKEFNIFANHHPISIVSPLKKDSSAGDLELKLNSLGMLMNNIKGESLLSSSFNATLHGHVHTVQAISYQFPRPISLISGNGGSALEDLKVKKINLSQSQMDQMKIQKFESFLDFGFATLDRQDQNGSKWLFTEYNREGKIIFSCSMNKNQTDCNN